MGKKGKGKDPTKGMTEEEKIAYRVVFEMTKWIFFSTTVNVSFFFDPEQEFLKPCFISNKKQSKRSKQKRKQQQSPCNF